MGRNFIDLNADLGESPDSLANGTDFELMRYISSANIACGGHAGDADTMAQTLAMAKELNVAAGAHPSYPDRKNFGRVETPFASEDLETAVRDQISSLARAAEELGVRLAHVKPHGALYHVVNREPEMARALSRAVLAVNPNLIMVAQAGAASLDVYRAMGLRAVGEAFADRAYEPDGSLRSRTLAGALNPPDCAAGQALRLAVHNTVAAADGSELTVMADTICLHSDSPGAVEIAREVNRLLKSAGISLQSLC